MSARSEKRPIMWRVAFAAFVACTAAVACGFDEEDDTVSEDTLMTVLNVLHQDSWYWTSESTMNVANQQVFVGGRLQVFAETVGMPPRVDQSTVRNVTSTMYVALSCKCGETIAEALAVVHEWLRMPTNDAATALLADANAVVLKTTSVLFRLAEIAPNAWSHEPGMLHAAVSLNLHLNRLVDDSGGLTAHSRRRVVFQMINLIERFTIPNCSSNASRSKLAEYISRCRRGTPALTPKETALRLFKYLHGVLDNAGLSTENFHLYNVMAPAADGTDFGKFNIVSHVMRVFRTAFGHPQLKCTGTTTVESVFSQQKSAFEFVLFVMHQDTLSCLKEFKENSKMNDEIFLSESNIKRNGLVRSYELLLVELVVQNFPPEFADHVRLILRIFNDVISFKTIRDIDFLIRKEENDVLFLSKRHLMQNKTHFKDFFNNHTVYNLQEFLLNIVTVSYVKYFNNIFKSLQNYFQESNGKIKENLNTFDYSAVIVHDSIICSSLASVYAHCFDIQLSIDNAGPTKSPNNVKSKLLNVLNFFKALLKREEQHENHINNYIITNAIQYLSYNLIKYPTDGDVQEKLTRILYTVTNFVDKYEVLYCNSFEYRDWVYKDFKNHPQKLKDLLNSKSNFIGKLKFVFNEISINKILCNRVLFKQFVKDFGGIQEGVKMFWKGELRTISDIRDDLNKNLFNYSSIPKYINVVVEWISAVFSYTLLDMMHHLLNATFDENKVYDEETKVFNNVIKNSEWAIHHSVTSKCIADEIRNLVWNVNKPFKIIGMLTMLTNNLENYNDVFQRQTQYQQFSSLDTKNLIIMKKTLIQMSKTKGNSGELQYKLTDFFLE